MIQSSHDTFTYVCGDDGPWKCPAKVCIKRTVVLYLIFDKLPHIVPVPAYPTTNISGSINCMGFPFYTLSVFLSKNSHVTRVRWNDIEYLICISLLTRIFEQFLSILLAIHLYISKHSIQFHRISLIDCFIPRCSVHTFLVYCRHEPCLIYLAGKVSTIL